MCSRSQLTVSLSRHNRNASRVGDELAGSRNFCERLMLITTRKIKTHPSVEAVHSNMSTPSSNHRRFDIGSSNQPILQFIATSIPFFVLCLWFLYSTARRPNVDCYLDANLVNDDATALYYSEECSQYVPLKQFAIVFLVLAFLWGLLVAYLFIYVPRRHALIEEYLSKGKTVIGDIYFNRQKRTPLLGLTAYGNAVYTHPKTGELLKRKVRVFERYTRERAAIVLLPDMPYSGQPKLDLEIDREVTDLNQKRLKILSYYAVFWLIFAHVAPIYIITIMQKIANPDAPPWQPDIDVDSFPMWYYIASFVLSPLLVVGWTFASWFWHKRWMTYQHKRLNEGDAYYEPTNCCFDDDDYESIEIADYLPPKIIRGDAENKEPAKVMV